MRLSLSARLVHAGYTNTEYCIIRIIQIIRIIHNTASPCRIILSLASSSSSSCCIVEVEVVHELEKIFWLLDAGRAELCKPAFQLMGSACQPLIDLLLVTQLQPARRAVCARAAS